MSVFCLSLLAACNGGGSFAPPPSPSSISVAITSPVNDSEVSGTVTISAAVNKNGSSEIIHGVRFKLDGQNLNGEDTTAPYSTDWDTNGMLNGSHSLTATVRHGANNRTATSPVVTVMLDNQVAPTLSLTPTSATVVLGEQQVFIFTTTGLPEPTVDCIPVALGSLTLNPGSGTYDAPSSPPADFDTNNTVDFACTATNSAGSALVDITINLEYPVPEIESISSAVIFVDRDGRVVQSQINGSGFYPGGQLILADPLGGTMTLTNDNTKSPTEISFPLTFGSSNWSPRWLEFTVSSPTDGPGGGISEMARMAFVGNQNTLALSATEAFQLDQGAGLVRVFDPATGIELRNFSVGRLTYHMAVDDVTGYVLTTHANRTVGVKDSNGQPVGRSTTNDLMLMAVAAKDEWGCVTQDQDDQIACFDLRQVFPPMLPLATFPDSQPWNIAMTSLGSKLVAAVFNIEDLQFSVVDVVPSVQPLRSLTLVGLTEASQLPSAAGGWQLAVFDSGPATGIAALLHQYDKVVVLVNLNTGQEIGRVDLSSYNPFRIVADNVNGALIVADADVEAGLTRFLKIDMAGNVTELQATTDLLTTGFGVSADGTKLYVSMRDQFQILDN